VIVALERRLPVKIRPLIAIHHIWRRLRLIVADPLTPLISVALEAPLTPPISPTNIAVARPIRTPAMPADPPGSCSTD
jgi:hypothetical protein